MNMSESGMDYYHLTNEKVLGSYVWKGRQELTIIDQEYHIPLEDNIREDVSVMCNLSQGIVDETRAEIIMNMFENNFTVEQIALATKLSIKEVETILAEKNPVLV